MYPDRHAFESQKWMSVTEKLTGGAISADTQRRRHLSFLVDSVGLAKCGRSEAKGEGGRPQEAAFEAVRPDVLRPTLLGWFEILRDVQWGCPIR